MPDTPIAGWSRRTAAGGVVVMTWTAQTAAFVYDKRRPKNQDAVNLQTDPRVIHSGPGVLVWRAPEGATQPDIIEPWVGNPATVQRAVTIDPPAATARSLPKGLNEGDYLWPSRPEDRKRVVNGVIVDSPEPDPVAT